MEVRVLGAHKIETRTTRNTCFLIDGVLGLDAGSLSSALSLTEQAQVAALLLTHRHLDHTRDIPALGLATLDVPRTIDAYSLPETLDAVHDHLLNWDIYPDLTEPLNSEHPKFRFHPVQPEVTLQVLGYQVKAISVPHPAPCIGFIVKSEAGACIAYTGDTGGNLLAFFQDSLNPQVLFVDVSFPNRLTGLAQRTGHLTPGLLREQLLEALGVDLRPPRMVAVHLSPAHQQELVDELAVLAEDLGIDLAPGHEGMLVAV
ncbi:MAG: MBL fold metallo-hydrolase [Dehalococcoidia bacterium]